jgi:Ca2+-binding EF-hand superfamily protein
MNKICFGLVLVLVGSTAAGGVLGKPNDASRHRRGRGGGLMTHLLDKNRDGKISRQETEEAIAAEFSRNDGDKDGQLSESEVAAAIRVRSEARRAQRFQKLDRNGDGRVVPSEAERMPAQRFRALDANSDGVLTREELVGGDQEPRRVAKLFRVVDSDGSGKVSRAELQAKRDLAFTTLDANKDGMLEPGEVRKLSKWLKR